MAYINGNKVLFSYIESALPLVATTEEEMTALLATAQIGAVYKYTGESGTYEKGALYIVEGE